MRWAGAEIREVWKCIRLLSAQRGGLTKAERRGTNLDLKLIGIRYRAWADHLERGDLLLLRGAGAYGTVVRESESDWVTDREVDLARQFLRRAKAFATTCYAFTRSDLRARTAMALRWLDRVVRNGERQLRCKKVIERLSP